MATNESPSRPSSARSNAARSDTARQDGKPRSLADVRALARILRQYDLAELEIDVDGARVVLKRGTVSAPGTAIASSSPAAPAAAPSNAGDSEAAGAVAPADGTELITSPFVGTFYRAASPESSPFVEVGQTVRKGQTLCIVEAMKLMNEIEAEAEARIVEILVKNGDVVEYGQPLFRIDPV